MRCRKASKVYKLLFWAQVASVWSPSWAKRRKGFKGATSAQRSNLYTDEAFHTEYIRYSEYRIELFHTTWHFRMFHSVTEKFHSVTEKFHSVIEKFHSVTEKCPALLASVTEKFHSVTEKIFRYTRNFSVTLGLESHYIECVEKRTWCDRKVLGKAIVCGKNSKHLTAYPANFKIRSSLTLLNLGLRIFFLSSLMKSTLVVLHS